MRQARRRCFCAHRVRTGSCPDFKHCHTISTVSGRNNREVPARGTLGRGTFMLRAIRLADGLRFGLCTLALVVASTAISTDPADARGRRKRHHVARNIAPYSPPYAAIVVDANSGNLLHAANPDALRHPASLTKIMTLYLLFEQIEAGKLSLDSRLPVSDHASQQAPSKLGLLPGQTLSVEEAIRALVTKSANDAAVVVAEAVGGDEDSFARMMTR